MISLQEEESKMFKDICLKMLSELSQYKNSDKEELMLKYINERLDRSFQSYEADIKRGVEYLNYRNELRVLKKLNRMNKG